MLRSYTYSHASDAYTAYSITAYALRVMRLLAGLGAWFGSIWEASYFTSSSSMERSPQLLVRIGEHVELFVLPPWGSRISEHMDYRAKYDCHMG